MPIVYDKNDSDRCPLLQDETNIENFDECKSPRKKLKPSRSSKWAAIVLEQDDISTNIMETRKPFRHPDKALWSSTSRVKQSIFLAAIVFILFYANFVFSSESDEQNGSLIYSHIHAKVNNSVEMKNESVALTGTLPEMEANFSSDSNQMLAQQDIDGDETDEYTKYFNLFESFSENSNRTSINATTENINVIVDDDENEMEIDTMKNLETVENRETMENVSTTTMKLDDFDETKAGYLVWTENCRIPNIDPHDPEMMKFFKKKRYTNCKDAKPLTQVLFNETSKQYVLSINVNYVKDYSKSGITSCCYKSIERSASKYLPDNKISYSKCIDFKKSTSLSATIESVIVQCYAKKSRIYINAHAMIPEKTLVKEKLKKWKEKDPVDKKAISVLLIGIDSVSRTNLLRAMPKTTKYFKANDWFELSGYNKIADNTYPNLMAVLTGLNSTMSYKKCIPTKVGGLEHCKFIWNLYRDHGYVTAYGEDEAILNTFNYLKKGFTEPPADYYMRPYLLAAEEHLPIKRNSGLTYCLGYKHSAEHIYDYALEFANRFKDDPYFGLFWTNTFSHNALSDCSAMDERMVDYLKQFSKIGTFNNSIVIVFSDHGMRFGESRGTLSGYYEERLPFFYIWLPSDFKEAHPEVVGALNKNKNRLTNPYDFHMTLKHILDLSGRIEDANLLASAEGCDKCQTFLKTVPRNRSCEEIGIEEHWCTCNPYQNIYKNSNTVKTVALGAIKYMNEYLKDVKTSKGKVCAQLQLNRVEHAYRAQSFDNSSALDSYRLTFYTKPRNGFFEATLNYNETSGEAQLTGDISRLNSYASDSGCVENGGAKKYCVCIKKK